MNGKVAKKWRLSIVVAVGLLAVAWVVGVVMAQEPEPNSLTAPEGGSPTWTFTYQGQLNDNGQPADGYYDFSITLWNTSTLGTQVGDTYLYDDPGVLVEDGIFSINVPPGTRSLTGRLAGSRYRFGHTGQALIPRSPASRSAVSRMRGD